MFVLGRLSGNASMFRFADRVLGWAASGPILLYQNLISKRMPRVCVYEPSCSEYCRIVWMDMGLFGGMALCRARLRSCTGGAFRGLDCPPTRRFDLPPQDQAVAPHAMTPLEQVRWLTPGED